MSNTTNATQFVLTHKTIERQNRASKQQKHCQLKWFDLHLSDNKCALIVSTEKKIRNGFSRILRLLFFHAHRFNDIKCGVLKHSGE